MQISELFRFSFDLEKNKEWSHLANSFSSLIDCVNYIKENWMEIIEVNLSPSQQSKIAYVLSLYNLDDMLKHLYSKYKNHRVGIYYLSFLNKKVRCREAEEIIHYIKTIFEKNPEESPLLYVDYIIEKIKYNLNCNNIELITPLIKEVKSIIDDLQERYPEKLIAYYHSNFLYLEGKVKKKVGVILEAKELFSQAIKILEENSIDDQYLLGSIFSDLASTMFYLDLDKSEMLYTKSCNIFRALGLEVDINVEKANLSYVRFLKGFIDESINSLIELVYFFDKNHETLNLLKLYLSLSEVFLTLNQFENTENYLTKSFEIMNEYAYDLVEPYLIAIDYNITIKNIAEAEKHLNLLKRYIEKIGNIDDDTRFVSDYNLRLAQVELLKENIWDAEQVLMSQRDRKTIMNSEHYNIKRNSVLIEIYLLKFRVSDNKNPIFYDIVKLFKEINTALKKYFSLFQWLKCSTLISQFYVLMNLDEKANRLFYKIKESLTKFNISDVVLKQISNNIEVELIEKYNKKTSQLMKLINSSHFDVEHLELMEINFFEIIQTFTPLKDNLLLLQIVEPKEEKVFFSYDFVENSFLSNELLASMVSIILKISKEIQIEKSKNNNNKCRFITNSGFFVTIFPLEDYTFSLISNYYTHDGKSRLINYANEVYPLLKNKVKNEVLFKKIQEHF